MHDLDDPYSYLATLRQDSPVSRVGESSFYLVTSRDLAVEAVARVDEFSSNLTATMVWNEDGTVSEYPIAEPNSMLHVLATADGPRHRQQRAMVMPSFSPKRVRRRELFIATTLRRLWHDGLTGDRIDWMAAVAQRLPMAVVAEVVGFPAYDIDDLIRWSFGSTLLLDGVVTARQLDEATRAVGELAAYLTAAFGDALRSPGETAMGDIARRVNAGELEHDAAVTILIQLVAAGAESTVSLLGNAAWLMGRHPDVERQLRANRALVPRFIEEVLRLESPFRGHYRHVRSDTFLGDTALPAGSHLYLMWGAANRDPSAFELPERVCLEPKERGSHMAFGKGLHMCVGAPLARLEATRAVEFLLDSTDGLDIAAEDPQWERSLLVRRLRRLEVTVR